MKVLIPDFLDQPTDARHNYQPYQPKAPIPAENLDAEVLLLWGNRLSILKSQLERMPRLRLLQTLSAGYDHILGYIPASRAQVPFCCGVGLHNRTVAEYCLMMTLLLKRRLWTCWQHQQQRHWPRSNVRHLAHCGIKAGERVLIFGFGHIGQTLAPLLHALGLKVSGVARRSGERAGVPTFTMAQLPQLLTQTDILINLLPGGDGTRHLFDRDLFAQLPSHAIFVNAGRGSSVREDHLIAALREGLLSAAALDVVQGEPLAEDSPLWSTPNLVLTPHIAGLVPEGWQQLLQDNLERLSTGQPLINPVQR